MPWRKSAGDVVKIVYVTRTPTSNIVFQLGHSFPLAKNINLS
jgi:hypothetical protein